MNLRFIFSNRLCPSPGCYTRSGLIFGIAFLLLFTSFTSRVSAQLPQCNIVYLQDAIGTMFNYDPTLPTSATNPVTNTIPPAASFLPGSGGLAVSPVLGSGNTTQTFYVATFTSPDPALALHYYDPVSLTWINTGHFVPYAAQHLAAGGGLIYALETDFSMDRVYKYDGTGDAVLLVNLNPGVIAYDIVADCEGNWYVVCGTPGTQPILKKYNSSGSLIQSWTVIANGYNIYSPGLGLVGNTLYLTTNNPPGAVNDIMLSAIIDPNSTSITLAPSSSSSQPDLGFVNDMGTCGGGNIIIPTISVTANPSSVCAGDSVLYTAAISGGGPGQFQWYVNGSLIPGANANTFLYAPGASSDTVTCRGTLNNPCAADLEVAGNPVSVTVKPYGDLQPDITVLDTTLCVFQPIPLTVTINNPSPSFSILWQPPSGILSAPDLATITVDPFVNNLYWVTVKDTTPGICGLSKTDTVHINAAPAIALQILNNDTVVCQGAVVPIQAVGAAGYTYLWSPGTGVSDSTVLQPTITINQPDLYTLTASYPGCPDTSATIDFDMHYIPALDLGPDKNVCQWTDVALEANVTPFRNDYIYQWTPAGGLSNPAAPDAYFTADSSAVYILRVQTPIGCADQDTIGIRVYPGGFGGITADTGYCPGGSARLVATGGTAYHWAPSYGLSDTAIADPVASPPTSTDYTVFIEDRYGCLDTEQVSIQVYPQAMLQIPDSVSIYPGEQYHLEPGTNCLYFSWFPSSGLSADNIPDPLISPAVRTRYFVHASTQYGCETSDSIDALVKETVIDMPNAFAPSGANKVFKPSRRGIARLKEFSIYNRWGNKVYSSTNIDEGWDGTKDGKAQPMGVYVYIIDAVKDNGETFTRRGNVTLIR